MSEGKTPRPDGSIRMRGWSLRGMKLPTSAGWFWLPYVVVLVILLGNILVQCQAHAAAPDFPIGHPQISKGGEFNKPNEKRSTLQGTDAVTGSEHASAQRAPAWSIGHPICKDGYCVAQEYLQWRRVDGKMQIVRRTWVIYPATYKIIRAKD